MQDDVRERELVRMFNLDWNPAHQRSGTDALLNVEIDGRACRFEVEVKSSTGTTVSTARDVGMEHIQKWRRKLFAIGFYSRVAGRPELQHCLCLTPLDLEPWIATVEAKILTDFRIALKSSQRLNMDDLFDVCGQQFSYSQSDARRLHKQQWTAKEYLAALDTEVNGEPRISQGRMLEILRLRSRYIAERGATLNNPHITKSHLARFANTNRLVKGPNWATSIRQIAIEFALSHPDHASILHPAAST